MQLFLESLLEMAPSDTQFDNLKKRVKELEGKLGESMQPNSSWIQRHQVLTWLISLTTLLVAFYAGVIPHIEKDDALQIKSQVNDSLSIPLQKLDGMSNDIAEINATLKAWAPFMAPELLKKSSSISQMEFNKSLPALRNALQTAAQVKAVVPSETLQQISQKLQRTTESSPDYWPTILQFIQFASANISLDVPPAGTPPAIETSRGIRMNGFAINHEVVLLDGGRLDNIIFKNSRIIFTNNPVKMTNVTFEDCVFEIPVIDNPGPYLKNASKLLLTANLTSVKVPTL